MPKYYCDYCDTYLTHDSPSVRKTHCTGRKHKDNVKFYYQKWMEEQAQHLIDATTAAFKAGKIAQNPFSAVPPPVAGKVTIPPPNMTGPPPRVPMAGIPPPGAFDFFFHLSRKIMIFCSFVRNVDNASTNGWNETSR